MKILFTRSSAIMSKMIRSVTQEDVSHCAISTGQHVIHSNLLGVHVETAEGFEARTDIVHTVTLTTDYERLFEAFLRRRYSPYDFGAMLYLGLRFIFPWLPKKNLWQCSGMYLCTEWVTEIVDGEADSMITPYKLFQRLQSKSP